MQSKELFIIFSSQEYATANHLEFWKEIAKNKKDTDVLIIDIFADMIVSRIRNKKYRITDHKAGIKKIENNLFVFRPMTFLRIEALPGGMKDFAMKSVLKQIKDVIDNFDIRKKTILYYDCRLSESLRVFGEDCKKIYFIYDEVYLNASTGKEIKGLKKLDYLSCLNADLILTMTEIIASRREEFHNKLVVLGNGASLSDKNSNTIKFKNAVGFIGNFRNWIDIELLEYLIVQKSTYTFCFAGPIESNMNEKFRHLLNNYSNTVYLGNIPKKHVKSIYTMVDIVIVPYKRNEHIQSTRPIKIVESIFNHTPVVTVPMDGYVENSFIQFAENKKEFVDKIDIFMNHKVDFNTEEFHSFLKENSWKSKVNLLIEKLEEI